MDSFGCFHHRDHSQAQEKADTLGSNLIASGLGMKLGGGRRRFGINKS